MTPTFLPTYPLRSLITMIPQTDYRQIQRIRNTVLAERTRYTTVDYNKAFVLILSRFIELSKERVDHFKARYAEALHRQELVAQIG